MRISDWSSDVCSSDLAAACRRQCRAVGAALSGRHLGRHRTDARARPGCRIKRLTVRRQPYCSTPALLLDERLLDHILASAGGRALLPRSEEHTSELQYLMRISYAVFCLTKQNHI